MVDVFRIRIWFQVGSGMLQLTYWQEQAVMAVIRERMVEALSTQN